MHIHIATLGANLEPVTKAVNAIGGIDVVYLLCGKRFESQAMHISNMFKQMCIRTHVVFVNGFDFQEVADNINRIYDVENCKGAKFSINITGGTNLMAAAACSCAFFIGATIYYVLWDDEKSIRDQLQIIPTPSIPNLDHIKGRTQEILKYILDESDNREITSSDVARVFNVDKQNSHYHLKKLQGEGLIIMERGAVINGKPDNRAYSIKITDQGKLIARWIGE